MQDIVKAAMVGASDGVYIYHVGVSSHWYLSQQCRNTSERVRRRGDISLSVLVSTSQYQRYRYYRISNR